MTDAVAKLVEKWREYVLKMRHGRDILVEPSCKESLNLQVEMAERFLTDLNLATAPPEQARADRIPGGEAAEGSDGLFESVAKSVKSRKPTSKEIAYGLTLEPLAVEVLSQPQPASDGALTFQQRVREWTLVCFGQTIADDKVERNHRFLEESLELVQALGCTQSEAHQLVDYVYGHPSGHQDQECGGVLVTLAALCNANQLDMNFLGDMELARVYQKIDLIRAKQAAKPKHSPLSEPAALASHDQKVRREVLEEAAQCVETQTVGGNKAPGSAARPLLAAAIRSIAGAVEKETK